MQMQTRLTALIAFLLAAVAPSAQGAVIVTAVESGGDVVLNGSGTLDLSGWSDKTDTSQNVAINPNGSIVLVGPAPGLAAFDVYNMGISVIAPGDFGPGVTTSFATSGSGDAFGFSGDNLQVPDEYISGDPLSGSATYAGETFASLGMDLGSYTWTWGAGGVGQTFTLNVVPEPSTAVLMSLGLAGLAVRRRRA